MLIAERYMSMGQMLLKQGVLKLKPRKLSVLDLLKVLLLMMLLRRVARNKRQQRLLVLMRL